MVTYGRCGSPVAAVERWLPFVSSADAALSVPGKGAEEESCVVLSGGVASSGVEADSSENAPVCFQ